MLKTAMVGSLTVAALATLCWSSAAPRAEAQSGSRTAKRPHYDLLWSWLQRANYRKWNGTDGKAPDLQKGESPHGALIKTYVNERAATDLKNLPSGSVIVKENYSPNRKLMAITVMQRSKGYDPKHGDWYYAKYMPNGKIATTPPEMKSIPVAGRFKMCIDCHSGAAGGDHAFLND